MAHGKRPNQPFQLGIGKTAGGFDLRRVGLPTGSPAGVAAAASAPGGGNSATGRPDSASLQVFPWWERPPLGSLNYNAKGQGIALAAAAATEVVLCTRTCPNGYVWCVRGINIFAQLPNAQFNVNYILKANGTALGEPYGTFGRVANSLEVPFSILEQGAGPTTLELVAVNVDGLGGAWTVGGSFTGWFTPTVLANATGGLGA